MKFKWQNRFNGHRPVAGKMNKTEAHYACRLDLLVKAGEIEAFIFEGIKFRLAASTFYTPDFIVVYPGHIEVHEVKGFWHDDARVKIKVAAAMFPWFRFCAVRKAKNEWQYEYFE